MNSTRNWILALSISLSGGVIAGGAGPDPLSSTPAGKLWQRVVPELQAKYVGRNRESLPRLVAEGVAFMRARCAPSYTAQACPEDVAIDALDRLTGALDDLHTGVTSAPVDPFALPVEFGFSLKRTSLGYVVTDVQPSSAAAAAGLRRGDLVHSINGFPLPTTAEYWRGYQDLSFGVYRQGKSLALVAKNRSLSEFFAAWSLPYLRVEGDVGVLRIPTFLMSRVAQRVHNLVRDANEAGLKSLVIDVRGNPGGQFEECVGAASAFVSSFSFGQRGAYTYFVRYDEGKARITSGHSYIGFTGVSSPNLFRGRVAVLVDASTASCGEVFAVMLQHHRRASVYGEATAGIANTNRFQTPISDTVTLSLAESRSFFAPDQPLPERVTPNVIVRLDLERLALEGRDSVLERALEDVRH